MIGQACVCLQQRPRRNTDTIPWEEIRADSLFHLQALQLRLTRPFDGRMLPDDDQLYAFANRPCDNNILGWIACLIMSDMRWTLSERDEVRGANNDMANHCSAPFVAVAGAFVKKRLLILHY
jgi:hypothetical protein